MLSTGAAAAEPVVGPGHAHEAGTSLVVRGVVGRIAVPRRVRGVAVSPEGVLVHAVGLLREVRPDIPAVLREVPGAEAVPVVSVAGVVAPWLEALLAGAETGEEVPLSLDGARPSAPLPLVSVGLGGLVEYSCLLSLSRREPAPELREKGLLKQLYFFHLWPPRRR